MWRDVYANAVGVAAFGRALDSGEAVGACPRAAIFRHGLWPLRVLDGAFWLFCSRAQSRRQRAPASPGAIAHVRQHADGRCLWPFDVGSNCRAVELGQPRRSPKSAKALGRLDFLL